jgi:hypothetical protein
VIRRGRAPMIAMMAALAYGSGFQSRSAQADQAGTADYTLTSTSAIAAPTGPPPTAGTSNVTTPQVVALIEPAGGVVTPAATSTQGPLTIMPGSQGFTSSGVYDFLLSTTDQNGNPLQALGLSFFGHGLAAGGVLNFSLNVTNANDPPLLVSQTSGVSIVLDATSASSSSSSSSTSSSTSSNIPPASTPEPLSLFLWTILAGAGFVRAGAMRRSYRVAASG